MKARAANQHDVRTNPRKYYSGVKSKVAGNMKSQVKAKMRAKKEKHAEERGTLYIENANISPNLYKNRPRTAQLDEYILKLFKEKL